MEESSGRLGADQTEARAAGAGLRADGHQSPCGTGLARFHEISCGQRHQQTANPTADSDCARRTRRYGYSGIDFVHADATALEVRAENDRGPATPSAGAYRPASGFLLRCQQDRRAGFTHHERRGRRPESHWDWPGGICRRNHDGGHCAGVPDSYERDHDGRRVWHPAGFRIRD